MRTEFRAFVGIKPPNSVQVALDNHIRSLKASNLTQARWVASEKIHLTLKFLGRIDLHLAKKVAKCIEEALIEVPKFHLILGEIGTFPSISRPRVVWVGLRGEIGVLTDLRQKIQQSIQTIGFSEESKPFHPHLTLARIRHISEKERVSLCHSVRETGPPAQLQFEVADVILIQSATHPCGSIYTPIASFPLHASLDGGNTYR